MHRPRETGCPLLSVASSPERRTPGTGRPSRAPRWAWWACMLLQNKPMTATANKQAVRLAAVGDLHIKKTSQGQLAPLLKSVNDRADVLLLCGDLTDYGLPEETQILVKELMSVVRIPIVA